MQRTVYTADQFRLDVVRPTLRAMDLPGLDAEELLLGTAAQETHLGALGRRQIGGGPALGIMQIEPTTHQLCLAWLERWRPGALIKIQKLVAPASCETELLLTDDRYAVAMARTLYWSIPHPIPHWQDTEAQCAYYLRWYNNGGRATREQYLSNYDRLIRGCVEQTVN